MDEAKRALTNYVWDYFSHLMTDFERRVGNAIVVYERTARGETMSVAIPNESGEPEAAVFEALVDGQDAYRDRVADRIVSTQPDGLFLNRCPKCRRLARTPKATQCFSCGYDWHGAGAN